MILNGGGASCYLKEIAPNLKRCIFIETGNPIGGESKESSSWDKTDKNSTAL